MNFPELLKYLLYNSISIHNRFHINVAMTHCDVPNGIRMWRKFNLTRTFKLEAVHGFSFMLKFSCTYVLWVMLRGHGRGESRQFSGSSSWCSIWNCISKTKNLKTFQLFKPHLPIISITLQFQSLMPISTSLQPHQHQYSA